MFVMPSKALWYFCQFRLLYEFHLGIAKNTMVLSLVVESVGCSQACAILSMFAFTLTIMEQHARNSIYCTFTATHVFHFRIPPV